ncbi:malate:quinone oxidoreductase [Sporolactobacillus kofuensis]|uniref:Probable malate:quinone oxidoreductase n=1 Tax=Sporolactobacillus kofuensis TaxID=269672 RepID=A0ABW1WGC1_9BACL|nr:malate:quinone oxidoreductase [Sporolactobacillus kofuensis]MCO7175462.1 malate:quinone oxidoreductase [Sporolactobacillus kofuensis]
MSSNQTNTDVILIGAGVMSATLGTLLKELAPDWKIKVFEKLANAGQESSNEWNNAGTGHSALCELNYTPEKPDGSIDITKAINVNEKFQLSRQFWSYLVKSGQLHNPRDFIRPIPHMSFVEGETNTAFLKKRFHALSNHPLFQGMQFSDDPEQLKKWIPLIMDGRTSSEPIAATKIDSGTDVNFGALTRMLFDHLKQNNVEITYKTRVEKIKRTSDGLWKVTVQDIESGTIEDHKAKFVFIGAGGGSLSLLQKTGIPESKHIGGFPVSGLFMVCHNPEVAAQHHAKVYGKAKIGAPPMSVPHLDTRYIEGKQTLLFGPFAGFSPKFLKSGSHLDLISSINPNNILTMLAAGVKQRVLTKYLIQQVLLSNDQRMEALREFIPKAKSEDWDIVVAGQRVQVIKDTDAGGRGTLQFGTEVVRSADGSIAALLGASPGASTAVHVMLEVVQKCFPDQMNEWEPKIKEMIPSHGVSLAENPELFQEIHTSTAQTLGLDGSDSDK